MIPGKPRSNHKHLPPYDRRKQGDLTPEERSHAMTIRILGLESGERLRLEESEAHLEALKNHGLAKAVIEDGKPLTEIGEDEEDHVVYERTSKTLSAEEAENLKFKLGEIFIKGVEGIRERINSNQPTEEDHRPSEVPLKALVG